MAVPAIDLNADVGEETATAVEEAALIELVTSASVSCGAHAGTAESLAVAVSAAVSAGVVVGAHPSYPDRARFGRHRLAMDPDSLARSLDEQLTTLSEVVQRVGAELRYVKPHGALYHLAATEEDVARLLSRVVERAGIPVLVLSAGAVTADVVAAAGVEMVAEGFVDRAYLADGSLASRQRPGAVLVDESAVVDQALSLALDQRASTVDGRWVEVRAASLCLHGDTPGAARLASSVRRALKEANVELAAFAR